MSQSTGWADCIMLAMAPIGVITIIVSAIRVGGYTWLKAVVGRARENIVAAELEVMSSTSKEACELWNGRNVVRCPGAADICEFICLYPTGTGRTKVTSARIMDIEQATLQKEATANGLDPVLHIRPKKRGRWKFSSAVCGSANSMLTLQTYISLAPPPIFAGSKDLFSAPDMIREWKGPIQAAMGMLNPVDPVAPNRRALQRHYESTYRRPTPPDRIAIHRRAAQRQGPHWITR